MEQNKIINKPTIGLMLKHALHVQELIHLYAEDMQVSSLIQQLRPIIADLENPKTIADASYKLLAFLIQLLPGNTLQLKNKSLQQKLNEYYQQIMRPEIISKLAQVTEQSRLYENYKNRFLKKVEEIDKKLRPIDQLIEKNTKMLGDLDNSLNSHYQSHITQPDLIAVSSLEIYEAACGQLVQFKVQNLRQNKKIFDIRGKISKRIADIKTSDPQYQRDLMFHPKESIIDSIINFIKENKDEAPFFVHTENNTNELGAVEWFIQNPSVLKIKRESEDTVDLNEVANNIKQTFLLFFEICDLEIKVSFMEKQLTELQAEANNIIQDAKDVRDGEINGTLSGLQVLRSYMKENKLYIPSKEELERMETSRIKLEEESELNQSSRVFNFGAIMQKLTPASNKTDNDTICESETVIQEAEIIQGEVTKPAQTQNINDDRNSFSKKDTNSSRKNSDQDISKQTLKDKEDSTDEDAQDKNQNEKCLIM